MKKSWRDKRSGPSEPPKEEPEKQLRVNASTVVRGDGHYGTFDLGFIAEAGLPKEAVEDVVAGLEKGPSTTIAPDPISKLPTVWLGPFTDARNAEAAVRGVVQLICTTLGIRQGDGPQIRQHDKGVFADYNTSHHTNPEKLGAPPDDLDQRIARGKELAAGSDDALTLMIAAWQRLLRDDHEAHMLRLVMLARGVIAWIGKPAQQQSPLEVLETRGRALAHLIADNIPRSDEFVLLLTNQGEGGFYTHISSIGRDLTISLLTEYLQSLRGDQVKRN